MSPTPTSTSTSTSTCQCTAGRHLVFSSAASWHWGGIFGVKVAWTCCCHEHVKQSMLSNNRNIMGMNEHVKPWRTNHEYQIMSHEWWTMSDHEQKDLCCEHVKPWVTNESWTCPGYGQATSWQLLYKQTQVLKPWPWKALHNLSEQSFNHHGK